jgi:hypothetical protein
MAKPPGDGEQPIDIRPDSNGTHVGSGMAFMGWKLPEGKKASTKGDTYCNRHATERGSHSGDGDK